MARYRRRREGSVAISEIVRFQQFKAVASQIAHASSRAYIDHHVADEALARSLYLVCTCRAVHCNIGTRYRAHSTDQVPQYSR